MNLDLSRVTWVRWPGGGCDELAPLSQQYDLFINSTYCSSMVSQARRSLYLVFFPQVLSSDLPWLDSGINAALRRLENTGLRRLIQGLKAARELLPKGRLARQFLESYQMLLANSEYTGGWVQKRWNRNSVVLPPPIDVARYSDVASRPKERLILSVGRFFAGGHNKKHLEMIATFRRLYDSGRIPPGWEYHLAGSVHRETDAHREYFRRVNEMAQGYPIRILGDLSSDALLEEYGRASIFWHGSGWGEEEALEPEKMEHFGMTTCEAMAAGVVPVVMPVGGQKETVRDGINGFYFHDEDELVERSLVLMSKHGSLEMENIRRRAVESVQRYSVSSFEKKLLECLNFID